MGCAVRRLFLGGLAVLLAACSASAASSPAPSLTAHGEAAAGDFRLAFDVPRATWSSSESIEGTAMLSVAGPASTTIGAAAGGPIAFGVAEVGGTRHVGPASDAACAPYTIAPASPISTSLVKSGGYGDSDPNAAFGAQFLADPGFRLPPGTWDITAYASFIDEPACGGPTQHLEATVRIRVTG